MTAGRSFRRLLWSPVCEMGCGRRAGEVNSHLSNMEMEDSDQQMDRMWCGEGKRGIKDELTSDMALIPLSSQFKSPFSMFPLSPVL